MPQIEELDARIQPRVAGFLSRCASDPWLSARGIFVVITSGRRAPDTQQRLWAIGRRQRPDGSWFKTGEVPVVTWTLDSAHCRGLAIDVAPRRAGHMLYPDLLLKSGASAEAVAEANSAFARLGVIGSAAGLAWGGRWQRPDRPHFELPAWRSLMAA